MNVDQLMAATDAYCLSDLARKVGVTVGCVQAWKRKGRISYCAQPRLAETFPELGPLVEDSPKTKPNDRAQKMMALYKSSKTLEAIGREFGVTRERVRQIISKYGVKSTDGGARVVWAGKRLAAAAKRDDKFLRRYGITYSQWKNLIFMGRGKSAATGPLGAFRAQQRNAAHRGIEWTLTLAEWWKLWDDSGKWNQRGRGQGYVMARRGDDGGYAVGNVYITTAIDNCSDAPKKKKSSLPTGVTQRANKFIALRMIAGKKYRLGTFDTPEAAHAAYIAFGESKISHDNSIRFFA